MAKLGFLYRKYLKGADLQGESYQVEIVAIKMVTVRPRPKEPPIKKWCMFVSGLPDEFPNGILFGPKVEEQLLEIFGPVELDALRGKQVVIQPVSLNVAGVHKYAIRFSPVQKNGSQPPGSGDPPDDIPF